MSNSNTSPPENLPYILAKLTADSEARERAEAQIKAAKKSAAKAQARPEQPAPVTGTVVEHPLRSSVGPVTQLPEPTAIPLTTERPDWLVDTTKPEGLVIQKEAKPPIEAKKDEPKKAKAVRAKADAAKAIDDSTGKKIDRESREILRYISEDFVMLGSGSKLVAYHIESGDELGKEAFKQYCAKHYGDVLWILPPKREGDPAEEKRSSAGDTWWGWNDPLRRVVRRVVMEPTSLPENDDNPEVFNRWHILKQTMAVPDGHSTANDIAILANHLMYLSGGDVVGVTFFLCWLAQLYQTPEIKMPTAVLLYSKYGRVGKNLLYRLLSKVFGQPLVANATGKQLQKNFDDAIEHIRILFINELARSEKVDGYENFKSQISEEDVQFEGKGRASRRIRNITHYVVTTNHEDALPLMENDGRIAVLRCLEPRKGDDYYKVLVDWIDGPGASALAQILATWKFPADWDPYAPVPQTAATRAMQRASRDELEVLLAELIEAGGAPCDKDIIIVDELSAQLNTIFGSSLTRRASRTSVGKALQAIGAEYCEKRIESPDGKTPNRKFYVIRNKEQWAKATPKQRGEHLNKGTRMFAVQPPDDPLNTEGESNES